MDTKDLHFDTRLIHSGMYKDEFLSATVPIYQTSTFTFKNSDHGAACFAGKDKGYIYTRIANPTINALEKNVSDLENGFGGVATASGMGAISTVYMALLDAGSHIICADAVYGPARVILEKHFARFGVESTFVDTTDIQLVERSIKANTKMIFLETPANPTIAITDIAAAAELTQKHGITLVVDNTFSSPYLQKPLDLGADIVIHSLTKFLNGHADIVGGMIVAKEESLYKKVREMMVFMGPNMDPHQAFMVLRGIKTLGVRIDRAMANAGQIADFLDNHPKISWVKYPGLKSHPQHELAKKQMKGFGSMVSFGVKGGFEAGKKLMDSVKLALLAVSLGGVETLIQHPASMTHASMGPEDKKKAGITDDLVRYSVGIENASDLIADLEQALFQV